MILVNLCYTNGFTSQERPLIFEWVVQRIVMVCNPRGFLPLGIRRNSNFLKLTSSVCAPGPVLRHAGFLGQMAHFEYRPTHSHDVEMGNANSQMLQSIVESSNCTLQVIPSGPRTRAKLDVVGFGHAH